MYRLRDYFEPFEYVREASYIFRYRKQVPTTLLQRHYGFADFSAEEAEEAFDYSLNLVPPSARPNIFAARVMMKIHLGNRAGAAADLQRIKAAGIPLEKELILVSNMLESRGG